MRLFYPLAAEPLVPGHVYAWYVEAKDIPAYDPRVVSRQPEIIQSEIFYFKFIDPSEAAGQLEVLGVEVEPDFIDAELETDYEFQAILELAGPGFADVEWRVVPSSAAIVVSRGEYAYVTPLRTGFISVIAESGDMSAYAVMRVGGTETEAAAEPASELETMLAERIGKVEDAIDEYGPLERAAASAKLDELEVESLVLAGGDAYKAALREAHVLLEPFFMSGNASAFNSSIGFDYKSEPFPGHIKLFAGSKVSYDAFIAMNLTALDSIQKELDAKFDELMAANKLLNDAGRKSIDAAIAAYNQSVNISYLLDLVENDLDRLLMALEVDASPFVLL
jgi:hypothetical protein